MRAAGDSLSWRGGPLPRLWSATARLPAWLTALSAGVALTLAQVLFACVLSGAASPADAYQRLGQWDSKWYAWIAEHGYPETLPESHDDIPKAGFFPGYPLATRLVATVTGLPTELALLLTAQLCCVGVWTYLLLFLRRWQVSPGLAAIVLAAVAVQPCAFFLVTGYSESLFLFAVLGFLFWSRRGGWAGWLLAAVHGVLMTATRIVGLPLAVCPLAVAAATCLWGAPGEKGRWSSLVSAGLLALVASLGGLAFFAFCQLQYGRWDAYMLMQRAHWGVAPDYLAVFRPDTYAVALPDFVNGLINPNYVSRISVPLTALFVLGVALIELRLAKADASRRWLTRLGLYLAAGLMFFIAVSGLANSKLISMTRYVFCVHVVLALAAAHLLAGAPSLRGWGRFVALAACAVLGVASLACQIAFIELFTRGEWVA